MKKKNVWIISGIAIAGIILLAWIFLGDSDLEDTDFSEEIDEKDGELDGIESSSLGLGDLCSGEQNCREFCLNNRGQCEAFCKGNKNELCASIFPPSDAKDEQVNANNKDEPPVLRSFGFDIGPWNKQTNLAGNLMFTKDILFEDDYIISKWVFIEFGAQGQRKSDSVGSNIEYWFFVPMGTEVIAPVDGIAYVEFFEHTKDFGINFHAEDSNWIVSFEHVVDVKVKDGDFVKVGDVVSKAAPRIGNKVAMTEFAVWRGGQNVIKYCPFNFLDESLKPIYKEKLNQLAKDWEEFIGKDVYQQEKWVAPGCLVESIVEK